MHRRRRWRRPRRRWRRRWRRMRPPGGRGRCSSSAFGLRTAGRHRTRRQKRPAEGRLRAGSTRGRARACRRRRRAATRRAAAHRWRWRARPTRLQAKVKRPARIGRAVRGPSSEQQGGTRPTAVCTTAARRARRRRAPKERGWSRGTLAAAGACAHRAAAAGGAAEDGAAQARHFCQPSAKVALDLERGTRTQRQSRSALVPTSSRAVPCTCATGQPAQVGLRSSCAVHAAADIQALRCAAEWPARAVCMQAARRSDFLVAASTRGERAPRASK